MKPLLVTGGIGSTGKAILVTEGKIAEFLSVDGGEIYGIAQGHGFYFVAVRGQSRKVLKLDSKLKTVCYSTLPQTADPHCIYIESGVVHVISSSEDLIYKFTLDLDFIGREVFGFGGNNRFHTNDVTKIGSEFFVSMFTDRQDGNWNADVGQGFIKSGSTINPLDMKSEFTGLCKPHSPVLFRDDLWVCDSGRGSVWCNNSKMYQEQGAWSRGLCVEDDFIHVGISDSSRAGKSKLVTLTRSGDVVRELVLPLGFIYGITVDGRSDSVI